LNSTYFENTGNGKFTAKALPLTAQVSLASCFNVDDFNHDGKKDILLGGNFYHWRVQLGKNDASMGSLLLGNGHGKFSPVSYQTSGLMLNGDVRDMLNISLKNGRKTVFFSRSNGRVGAFQLK
jgi:hypothetical protein